LNNLNRVSLVELTALFAVPQPELICNSQISLNPILRTKLFPDFCMPMTSGEVRGQVAAIDLAR